jgi:hypothetical protein
MRRHLLGAALALGGLVLGASSGARAQSITSVPSGRPPGPESRWRLEHLESPEEIALGTMAVNVWARIAAEPGGEGPAAAFVVLPEKAGERRIDMRPLDGALDGPVEDFVATIDTYAWVRDAAHEFEIRVRGTSSTPVALTRGTIRVKPRIAAADLLLFDREGAAHAWIGSGAGGFSPAGTIAAGSLGARPTLADTDGDGRLDLITTDSAGEVSIHRNRGLGRFELARSFRIGHGVVETAVGDVDGDGRPDLVSVSRDLGLEIRPGLEEAPAFTAVLDRVPDALGLADLDGDGADEIWVALLGMNDSSVQAWTRVHEPGGELPLWRPEKPLEAVSGPRGRIRALVRRPVDSGAPPARDGLLVLSGNESEGVLESWERPADTQAGSEPALTGASRLSGEPLAVVTGRFGPDGSIEWRVAVRDSRTGTTFLVSETGPIESGPELVGGIEAFAACDLDGDGDDDLLAAGEDLRLWMNVRGAFREAGESPYRLETPILALLPGSLDERTP